ncbi:chromosome segregation protein SMC [Bacillus solimangrovi]|uniref:Chromosome partition protein Smc n=1 Tax=Bacillus solimangrovi TaxID=1305675 RepID=A0A1E5LAW7_9BACI|nr:chromosome segregation protein SMC [Bacillus solimangrovi]OEH91232.1 chromosome segregation protein SMC [Bacillus solimangrovi]
MFLKRLDVSGFKSFAEKTSVEFVPGVTAVVGPNGSGKSNITDAIRWVLGEQSARSIRGSKMEDIIFSGSESRRAVNVADVTITLENEDQFLPIDYQEVSITRRVYRSGESEFFMNKQACRLKDIIDLFMDSGLGKESFSIIGQGRVEEILSSKAEDRRSIFEEAAGVLKYKVRKRKAEMKLAETQENLHRVEDILHEIDGQLEPLKIQASIARDYIQKKEELEQVESALIVHEIETLHEKWQSKIKQFEVNKDRELQIATKVQNDEAEIVMLRNEMQALDDSINELQDVLLKASSDLEKLEGKKQVLHERKKNAEVNRSQLEKVMKDSEAKLEQLIKELREKKETLSQKEQEVSQDEELLKELQEQLAQASENIEEQIEELKSEYIERLNEQASLNNERHNIETQLTQQGLKQTRLSEGNEQYINQREAIRKRRLEQDDKLAKQQVAIEFERKQYQSLQAVLSKMKDEYEKMQSQLYKGYQYVQQTRSRKQMLEEMQEDYAGFFQGVKDVLKADLTGVCGAIAELISVDKQYETAVEIALGGGMQNIVVETEKDARNAINYLKKNRSGRATFLPLSVIKGKRMYEAQLNTLQRSDAFVGIAADLISFDGRYEEVVYNLLGTTVVAKDLKGANELARLLNHRFRIVTLDGDVVNPGGSMTGGASRQKAPSLLSRQRELEVVSAQLLQMEEKTTKLEADMQLRKVEIKKTEEQLEVTREKVEQLRFDEQSLMAEIREMELEQKNINEHLSLYDREMATYKDDEQTLNSRLINIEKQLGIVRESLSELEVSINELTDKKKVQQQSKETLQERVTELKVTTATKKEALSSDKQTFERLCEDEETTRNILEEAKEDLELLHDEMNERHSGENKLETDIRQTDQQKEKTLKLIQNRRQERIDYHDKLELLERELKEVKRQHKGYIEQLKDDEVQINRLDVELENRLNHLSEEYSLTFEAAKEKYSLTVSEEEARKQVKLIRMSIDELGTVNLGAIDEYDRIFERHRFLHEQKDDLMEAKSTLHQVIDEMDTEVKKRFSKSFEAIRSEFQVVFRELFGGGKADLQMNDPHDLLNTGIEIVAQPPGKKLQNLSLLSGGERALTAIALLFAILKVRPVPFCVLDEVEAALDEANVMRFAQYLKEFSIETQFIVITHRKGTMERADVLYGVTMQDSGVSKMVSVKLEDSKRLVEQ